MTHSTAIVAERITLAEFEEMLLEKPEHEKWELIDGRVYRSMVGARIEHHDIVSNIHRALDRHIEKKGLGCRVLRETFFLKADRADLSALPDLMVHCGEIPAGATFINDPVALFEVSSQLSDKRDRVDKRLAYQQIPSLDAYVIVALDRMLVDVYARDAENKERWLTAQLAAPDDEIALASLDFTLPLREVYRGVLGGGSES